MLINSIRSKPFFIRLSAARTTPIIYVVLLCVFIATSNLYAQNVTGRISLNQLGFYNYAPKKAIISGSVNANRFYIAGTNLRDTFFTGTLGSEQKSAYSNTRTRVADFSGFDISGSYVVLVPGVGHSYVFEIGSAVNKLAAIATLKGYYYQRASMPLEEAFAGRWHRSAGHPDDVVYIHASAASVQRAAGTSISSPGGWYDAGDYNKYIVNSGVTMGTLLSAWEDFPGHFKTVNTNIPESRDAVPDILNEALYNLRWMLTMQDPNDGGVYNKCTNAGFDGMIMPGITKAPRYVVQKGTAATLDFAAVTAQASRIFKSYRKQFPGLSDSCLAASKKAWLWAKDHPQMEYNQAAINKVNKPELSTGGYGDVSFADEWLWAAAELYCTTKDASYSAVVNEHMKDNVGLPGWANVGMLGYYTYLRFVNVLPSPAKDTALRMKERIIHLADGYLQKTKTNAFATVMGQSVRDFNWGGNANAANQGNLLIVAYQLTGNKNYLDHALTNLDYLLGRNATGFCFVTGLGSKSPMHPHHRPSVGDGITEPIPGLLVGGPNPGMQDKCQYDFTEPETAYADIDCSYASNEIAINWNAPMVYLANAVEALKTKVGYVAANRGRR